MSDNQSLVEYYTKIADEAKFNEAVHTWGYDKQFLAQCGFNDHAGELFEIACGGGCPLRLEGEVPKKGSRIIDLGCGAGHDVVLAARLAGKTGSVIGVDLTPAMLQRTQKTVDKYRTENDAPVRLVEGCVDDGTYLSKLEGGWADLIISNGAFNLCADKKAAFATVYRLLKPGGRFHLTDVVIDPEAAEKEGSSGGTCSIKPAGGTCGSEKPATACSEKPCGGATEKPEAGTCSQKPATACSEKSTCGGATEKPAAGTCSLKPETACSEKSTCGGEEKVVSQYAADVAGGITEEGWND